MAALTLACGNESVRTGVDGQMVGLYATRRLLLSVDPDTVLVARAGEPFIRVGEFNERCREFPVGDVGQSIPAARRQVLEQLIDHKLLALEAPRRFGQAMVHRRGDEDPYAQERVLAHGVIRAAVANPTLVSDEEARGYLREHKERFPEIDPTGSTAPEALLAVKFSMLSDRMQDQLRNWRLTERIEVFQELLGE